MSSLSLLCLFLPSLLLSPTITAASNSSLKTRINLPAFEFFSKTGHHIVDEEIPKIEIPPISIPIKEGPGEGKVSAYNMKIVKFKSPKFDFNLSEDGISWRSREGSVKIKGDWTAEYTLLVPLSQSGWIQALVSEIRVVLGASLKALEGKPQIDIGECTVDIAHLDIEIGGGVLPWLVNLFRSDVSAAIKKAIHREACDSARSVLLEEANMLLLSLPSHVPIGNDFYVDYSIDSDPLFTSSYAEVDLSADVVYGNTSCIPTRTQPWTDPGSAPGMVTVWVSESIPNCLLSSAHQGNLVEFTVTKDIPQIANYLKTSCSVLSICIGRFFGKLKKEYPNQYVDLYFHTHKAPLILFEKDNISLNVTFAVDIHIHPMSEHPTALARLVLESTSSVLPRLEEGRLVGSLNGTAIDVSEEFSTIGDMSPSFLSLFEKVFSMTTRVLVESVLHKGLPIPIIDNVTLANTTHIHVFDDFVRLNIDFEFE